MYGAIAAVAAVLGVTDWFSRIVTVISGTAATAATGHHTSSCRSCRASCRLSGQLDVLPYVLALRILAMYEAKTAENSNFWVFWSITLPSFCRILKRWIIS